jgi:hypothetical protein
MERRKLGWYGYYGMAPPAAKVMLAFQHQETGLSV